MTKGRYAFDLLFRHSNEVAISTRKALKQPVEQSRKIFTFLDTHLSSIENQPRGLARNVRMMLTARFINHMFSQLLLTERGLLLDAFNCSRAAIETTAYYWLVLKDPSAAELYDSEKSLKPVEVRKRLEVLNINITALRDLYGLQSQIAHVGNKTDGLQVYWASSGDGRLLIGGGGERDVQRALLVGMVKSAFRFVKYDEAYIVPDLDQVLPEL